MKIDGMIKSVQAAIAAGGADVTQTLKIEVFGDFKDLRGLMQKPLKITLEASQMELTETNPMATHAVDTTAAPRKGRRKEKVPA
jgi:hypothetical protein